MADIIKIIPKPLSGTIEAMPSKSLSHRAAICATLAGNSKVENIGMSRDILCTLRALNALGYEKAVLKDNVLESGIVARRRQEERVVDCEESGSTLRMLIPQALDGVPTLFTGSERLMQRSMSVYQEIFEAHNIRFSQDDKGIFVQGKLSHGLFSLRGDVSSQFISGLLLALPFCRGDSIIALTTDLQSKAYVDLTIDMMRQFGVEANWTDERTIHISGMQRYHSAETKIEGDYSHAAFLLAAGVLGEGTTVLNLRHDSLQGDHEIVDILKKMDAKIEPVEGGYQIFASKLKACEIDVSQVPDLFPILSVLAAFAEGESRLVNGSRLRDKESDRLAAMAKELGKLGIVLEEKEDALFVRGNADRLLPGHVICSGYNDHRVVMSLAIAASRCKEAVCIDDAHSVEKSAPDFWEEYRALGGKTSWKDEADYGC